MSAKHTPGPWKFVHDEPYEMSIETLDGEDVLGLELWLDDACFDLNGERVANGRLAAAAPLLADALTALLADRAAQCECPLVHAARAALRAAGRLP